MSEKPASIESDSDYRQFAAGIADLLTAARRQAARAVNTILTATYWETGRRIVEFEQGGKSRAGYGEAVLARLSADLIGHFGRGFSVDHLELMRKFYLLWPISRISESLIRKLKSSAARIRPAEFGEKVGENQFVNTEERVDFGTVLPKIACRPFRMGP